MATLLIGSSFCSRILRGPRLPQLHRFRLSLRDGCCCDPSSRRSASGRAGPDCHPWLARRRCSGRSHRQRPAVSGWRMLGGSHRFKAADQEACNKHWRLLLTLAKRILLMCDRLQWYQQQRLILWLLCHMCTRRIHRLGAHQPPRTSALVSLCVGSLSSSRPFPGRPSMSCPYARCSLALCSCFTVWVPC
jgi:hypothetical protein